MRKNYGSIAMYGIGLLALAVCLLTVSSAQAVVLYWLPPYPDGGGAGDWNTTDTSWGTDPGAAPDTIWSVNSTDDARFGGSDGDEVDIQASGISVHNITFDPTDGGDPYDLYGYTITLAGTNPTIAITNAGDTAEIDSILAGNSGMIMAGPGSLVLTKINSYTGGTTIQAGTLSLSSGPNRLSTSGAITITGGSLSLGGNSQTTSGAVSIQGGTIMGGTIIKSGSDYDGQAGTVSASLQGAVGLTKNGSGTLTLSGANTYSNGTTINLGTLQLSTTPSPLSATGAITITGGVLDLGGAAVGQTTTGQVTIQGGTIQNGTLTDNGPTIAATAGTVSASLSGSAGITKTGAGTLTLSGSNSFTGKILVSVGQVTASNANAFGAIPALYTADQVKLAGGTTLSLPSSVGITSSANMGVTLGSVAGDMVTIIQSGTSKIDGLTGPGGLIINGSGTLRPNGNNTTNKWTYQGDTLVEAGTLSIVNDNDLPNGNTNPLCVGDTYLYNGTSLNINNHNEVINSLRDGPSPTGTATVVNSSGSSARNLTMGYLDHSGTFSGTFTGLNTGSAPYGRGVNIVKVGGGTQTFSGNLTAGLNNVTVTGGTVKFMSACQFNVVGTASTVDVQTGATFDLSDFGVGVRYVWPCDSDPK